MASGSTVTTHLALAVAFSLASVIDDRVMSPLDDVPRRPTLTSDRVAFSARRALPAGARLPAARAGARRSAHIGDAAALGQEHEIVEHRTSSSRPVSSILHATFPALPLIQALGSASVFYSPPEALKGAAHCMGR